MSDDPEAMFGEALFAVAALSNLVPYVRHPYWCRVLRTASDPCDCGLAEAWETAKPFFFGADEETPVRPDVYEVVRNRLQGGEAAAVVAADYGLSVEAVERIGTEVVVPIRPEEG